MQPNVSTHGSGHAAAAPRYDAQTMAMDALAAAGHIVRGFDLTSFDPLRAALAAEHAPLVLGAGGDVQVIAARITRVLPQSLERATAQVRAEQEALRDL